MLKDDAGSFLDIPVAKVGFGPRAQHSFLCCLEAVAHVSRGIGMVGCSMIGCSKSFHWLSLYFLGVMLIHKLVD